MSSNGAESAEPELSKEELEDGKKKILEKLEQEAGKINLLADLAQKILDRLHELHKSDPNSPDIPALNRQIQELGDETTNVRKRYEQQGKNLKIIQSALDEFSQYDGRGEEEQDKGSKLEEVKAELGGRLDETDENVSKLKETVDGHTEQIARHGQDIEALKQGPPPKTASNSSPSNAPAKGQVLEAQQAEETEEKSQGSPSQVSQAKEGSAGEYEIPESSQVFPSVAIGTGSGSGTGSEHSVSGASSQGSSELKTGSDLLDSVRSEAGLSNGPPSHLGSSSQTSSVKDASVSEPTTDDASVQADQSDERISALQETLADVGTRVDEHDEAISQLGKTQEEHTTMLATHDDAISQLGKTQGKYTEMLATYDDACSHLGKAQDEQHEMLATHDEAITHQIETTNALSNQVNQHSDQINHHSELLTQHRERVAGHDVHLGYHTDNLKDVSSEVFDQSLVLARVDTKLRHYDQQFDAQQRDGRVLAAQGQKLEHIEERVKGNNERVEQVEKVVQALQEKGKEGPVAVWPWLVGGGGVLAAVAGLGGFLLWKMKKGKDKKKANKEVVDSEEEDTAEGTDSNPVAVDGTVNLVDVPGRKKGRPRRRPRPNRLHARHWNIAFE